MRYSELQRKDVVNVSNGQKIGTIVDIIISDDGKIDSLVIDGSFWGKLYRTLGGKSSTIISYSDISSIGTDVVFVNMK